MSYGYEDRLYNSRGENLVARAAADERAAFIRRTYAIMAGAVLVFIGVVYALLQAIGNDPATIFRFFPAGPGWLLVLLVFMGASFLARSLARSTNSPGVQYLGLFLYVVVEAVIFIPLIFIALHYYPNQPIIQQAAVLTLAMFLGLTFTALFTQRDYSFLTPILSMGFLLMLGVIIAGALFGFTLGLVFCFIMVALISGSILVNTSNIMHHYATNQHVAAALELFASIAILFWYVLQILMILNDRR
jgi:FtsH-binding integral membrane protein